jgi:hypothetical protein
MPSDEPAIRDLVATWMRYRLRVTKTPPGGPPMVRSGYTRTILRRNERGNWVIARDANLLGPVPD